MIIENTDIERVLKNLLQKNIIIYNKNKVYKKGRLLLFKQNNYHLELTIEKDNNDVKHFEIPIPFSVEEWDEDNLVYFDYRLLTLAKTNKKLYNTLKNITTNGNSKFYDTILEIEIHE